MIEFPEVISIPLADWIDAIMNWLLTNMEQIFDIIRFIILQVMLAFENLFTLVPWFVIIILVFLAGWEIPRQVV